MIHDPKVLDGFGTWNYVILVYEGVVQGRQCQQYEFPHLGSDHQGLPQNPGLSFGFGSQSGTGRVNPGLSLGFGSQSGTGRV